MSLFYMHLMFFIPSRLELVFDAVLESLPPDLHGSQYQAVTDEVRRVADTLAGLETAHE